jgi:predicted HTH domain antitoxin
MQTMTFPYPDSLPQALHLSKSEFEREARMAMAVKLFDAGRLTSGQAAELAGLARVHFLYELGRWGVSALQGDEISLEDDATVAQHLHDRHQH